MFSVDIGNERSKAAYVDPAGNANIILNERGEPWTMSKLHYEQPNAPLIGIDAIDQGYVNPDLYIKNFKQKLGTTENLINGNPPVTATDAAAAMIGHLKKMAEKQLGQQIIECVATCPANFRNDSKKALLEAFERNGLKVLRLLPEPTAAGIAYALNKGSDKICLVFDFGGGTFDVSILHIKGAQINILATEGVSALGGNDFNECLKKIVIEKAEAQLGKALDLTDALFRHDIDQRIEAAKISLNNRKNVSVVLHHHGNQAIVEVTQDEFHKATDHLIQQSLDALQKAVKAAGLTLKNIDHLVMVGGTSKLLYIQQKVADFTGLYPKTDIDPDRAVAYGAAYACIAEMAKDGKTAKLRGQVIPAPEIFVRDVTAHDVGCCVIDNSSLKNCLINAAIIHKNTPIPCHRSDLFYLEHEDQIEARIEILQGEADADRDDCLLIGELALKNLPKETCRSPRIQIEYIIDANGMITATATDKVSGTQQTVSVDYKKGMKPKNKPQAA
ncbi:MAG: Hsp70 family protein [Phycisphaerae bacterium]|jgi:molecular chaperone DnaK